MMEFMLIGGCGVEMEDGDDVIVVDVNNSLIYYYEDCVCEELVWNDLELMMEGFEDENMWFCMEIVFLFG